MVNKICQDERGRAPREEAVIKLVKACVQEWALQARQGDEEARLKK